MPVQRSDNPRQDSVVSGATIRSTVLLNIRIRLPSGSRLSSSKIEENRNQTQLQPKQPFLSSWQYSQAISVSYSASCVTNGLSGSNLQTTIFKAWLWRCTRLLFNIIFGYRYLQFVLYLYLGNFSSIVHIFFANLFLPLNSQSLPKTICSEEVLVARAIQNWSNVSTLVSNDIHAMSTYRSCSLPIAFASRATNFRSNRQECNVRDLHSVPKKWDKCS